MRSARSRRDAACASTTRPSTIADGARTVQIGERTFAVLSELCAGISLVDDDAARAAMALVLEHDEAR